ncbi:MAG: HAMP domain-containing protein, partial [Nitrospiraceae bacterium]|nr:HAMP domain-containing protein [Nitrospiraceae bacterium]
MFNSLWKKFFLLLVAVCMVALSAAFFLREFMVSDFREYMAGEMEDRAYWVTAALESTYERYSGWERQAVIEDAVWALMLGFEIRLYDEKGALVTDTRASVGTLSPLVKKRIMAIAQQRTAGENSRFLPYALFLGGKEIGRLDVRFLHPKKSGVFVSRSNRFLLISLLALGGFAIVLSIIFSRRLTNPIEGLTDAVSAVGAGDLKKRVALSGKDEIGRLSEAFNRMAHDLEIQESLRRRLTSHIAHELRTPISAIRGEIEGMIDGLIPADKEHLQSFYAEIGRLRRIIEGIEELSQAEASGLTLRKQALAVRPFLANIVERYRTIFGGKGVSLELAADEATMITADPDRLSQIVINLLGNALKATDKGGRVVISASPAAGGTT